MDKQVMVSIEYRPSYVKTSCEEALPSPSLFWFDTVLWEMQEFKSKRCLSTRVEDRQQTQRQHYAMMRKSDCKRTTDRRWRETIPCVKITIFIVVLLLFLL